MMLRDQIEARTNAANTSAVWKHLKLYEKELYTNNYKHETLTARDCLVLHLMSPMRRGRGGCCWLLWWLKSRNGLKRLVNNLQNATFSKTNCMHSNSAARARGTRVQSPKRWNTVTHHLLMCIIFILQEFSFRCIPKQKLLYIVHKSIAMKYLTMLKKTTT